MGRPKSPYQSLFTVRSRKLGGHPVAERACWTLCLCWRMVEVAGTPQRNYGVQNMCVLHNTRTYIYFILSYYRLPLVGGAHVVPFFIWRP